eukprot:COSAG06_NODE_2740_length_6360_cov_4.271362_5_plen_59_part_00
MIFSIEWHRKNDSGAPNAVEKRRLKVVRAVHRPAENTLFPSTFLCPSRACLGKTIVFV